MTRCCTKCGETKAISEYPKDRQKKCGYRPDCKECCNKRNRKYYEENPNKEYERRERRREYAAEKSRKWRKNNPKWHRALTAARKAHVKRATPAWADLEAIKEFYRNCPNGYHVDHIIPLRGKIVSGLHVLDNLQYLTPNENLRKSNKHTL